MGNLITGLTALTGGANDKALDWIDGNALSDGDLAEVWTSDGIYRYRLDATASATENSPLRINPDTNAGTKSWCLIWTSARIGALVYLSSTQSIANATLTKVSWEIEEYDDTAFWEGVTNPSRFTIPVGVTGVIISAGITWDSDTNGYRNSFLYKNGATTFQGRPSVFTTVDDPANVPQNFSSGLLVVTETDYFEVGAYHTTGGLLNILNNTATWFSIEATHFA